MTYETMDWETEAKRLMAAFDLKDECRFVSGGICMDLKYLNTYKWPTTSDGDELMCVYTSGDISSRGFSIQNDLAYADVYFDYNGELISHASSANEFPVLIRAFHYLGFLTPEVEAELQVSTSHHQKLEWTLEYEARNGF